MNKKVLYFFIIVCIIVVGVGFVSKSTEEEYNPISSPTSSVTVLDTFGNGTCSKSSDCTPSGCSSHICSNDPNLITDCALPTMLPSSEGYSCGCVNNKCAWYR